MKKRYLILLAFSILHLILSAQEKGDSAKVKESDTRVERAKKVPINVFFVTDIGFASSANDTRKEASAGTGKLGLDFERGFVNGNIQFTVFSQNKNIATADTAETKLFGSNLLIPQNSSNNISNFSFYLCTRSFFSYGTVPDDLPLFSLKRFGGNFLFQLNNTNWVKDSLTTPVTINTFNFNLVYNLLNLEVLKSKEKIRVFFTFGYTGRRLGGDYGLKSNEEKRNNYLDRASLGFDGYAFGARLELGKFYGQMSLSYFDRGQNIKGFSGNQAVITLGIKADIKLAAKNVND